MLQSIIIYGIMCLSLYFLPHVYTGIDSSRLIVAKVPRQYKLHIVCSLLVFAFFSGVRWDVGVDHLGYIKNYNEVGILGYTLRTDMEVGFIHLMQLFNKLGLHFSVFFGFIAFMQLAFVYSYFKDSKYLIPFVGMLIMCSGDFFAWMNGIRQCLIATFFLFMIRCMIIERRLILFIICVYLCSFIHKSALLLLVFYPLTYLQLEKIYINKNIQYAIFFGALILSSMNLWQLLLSYIDPLFEYIGYDRFSNMDKLLDDIRTQNFGPRKIIFFLIDFILIFQSGKLRETYPNKLFGFSYIMFMIFFVTQPLFANSLVISRFVVYYYIFRIIISSYLLFYLFKVRKSVNNTLLAVCIIFLYVLHLLIQIYVDKGGHTDCIRYQFFWDHLS